MKQVLWTALCVLLLGGVVGVVVLYKSLLTPAGVALRDAALTKEGAARFDHGILDRLLRAHVRDGVVDYAGLKAKEAILDAYLKAVADADVRSLAKDEKLALFINAYNAFTLKLILEHHDQFKTGAFTSIRDIDKPWDTARWVVGGRTYKLGGGSQDSPGIEHDVLRKTIGDARIHFAINCASFSCPDLLPWAYRGDKVQDQLDAVTRAFVANPKHVKIEDGRLMVSSIMRWYAQDFIGEAGSVKAYLRKYADGEIKVFFNKHGDEVSIGYLTYNWSLNGK